MQAYQSAPCPFCGATWNPPGAQVCTNCRNQLPPPQPSYAPPGYAPQQGQPQAPAQGQPGQGFPYAPPAYPGQPGYQPAPGSYPGAPPGYPGQAPGGQPYGVPGQAGYPGQPGQYPTYVPPGYGQAPGFPAQGYPGYAPNAQSGSASATTLHVFGQSFTLPVALPPVVLQYQQQIAYALIGLVALLIVLVGVLPALAGAQLTSAKQAMATAVGHQPTVDAGFASLFSADPASSDLNVLKAAETKRSAAINSALASVQADESALKGVDQRLGILSIVALSSRSAISAQRQQIATALDGLKQADTALTAGSNLGKLMLPLYDVKIDYALMSNALNRHDLAGAAAPYPDAQQKIQQATSLAQAPGIPPVIASEVSTLSSLLDSTENLIQSIQNKDAAGVKKYSDGVQAGLKTMAGLALPSDYEAKTYGPNQKSYDATIKTLTG